MPKVQKTRKDRTARVLYYLDIGKGVFKMHSNGVFCSTCCLVLTPTSKYSLESHLTTAKHKENASRNLPQLQLHEVQPDKINEFEEEVVKTFLAADIPLHKLQNPYIQSLFVKYANKKLPSVTQARTKYINKLYNERIQEIASSLAGKKLWVGD